MDHCGCTVATLDMLMHTELCLLYLDRDLLANNQDNAELLFLALISYLMFVRPHGEALFI